MKVSTRNIKIIKDRLEKLYTEFNIECLGDDFKVEIGDEKRRGYQKAYIGEYMFSRKFIPSSLG